MTSACLACVLLLLAKVSGPPELSPGTTRALIRSGETQTYAIHLANGTVADLVLEQGGTDLRARVIPPNGEPFDVDARESGPEPVIIRAETSGSYRIEVQMVQKRRKPAAYQIELRIRDAGSDDFLRTIAQHNATTAKQADQQRSSEKLRQGIAAGREALSAWRTLGDRSSEAAALTELATLQIYLGNMEEARDDLLQALPIARASASPWTEAEALTNLGHVLWTLSSLEESQQRLEEAIKLWRELGNQFAEAAAMNNLGDLHYSIGAYQQSLRCFKQSQAIAISLGDTDHVGFTEMNLAGVYEKLAMDHSVIASDRRAISLFRKAGDADAEARTMYSLAGFYLGKHQLEKARALSQQARLLSEQIKNDLRTADAWKRLGDISAQSNYSEKASKEYQEALDSYRKASSLAGEAGVHVSLGKLDTRLHDYEGARRHFDQALATFRSLGRQAGEAITLQALGEMYRTAGSNDEAMARFNESLVIISKIGTPTTEAAALFELASVERNAGRLDAAQKHIERVLDLTESLRALMAGPQLRITYLASKKQYYEFAQNLYLRLDREHPGDGFASQALEVVERSHARALLDSIDRSNLGEGAGVDRSMRERQRRLREQLNFWSERLADASSKGNAARHKEATETLEMLLAKYHEVESENREADPRYALLAPRFLRVPDIQKEVLDADTVLLEYALSDESSHLWLLTSESLKYFELPARGVIENGVKRFYLSMQDVKRNSGSAEATAKLNRAAQHLSRMLLWPAAPGIRGKRLVIVGDSLIATLPFAALPSPESGAALIVDHEVVLMPSAAVMAEQRRLVLNNTLPTKSVAVIADPVFDAGDVRIRHPRTGPQPAFARLPFTRREAEAIMSIAPKSEVLRALDFDADRDLFTSNRLAQYKILHIATHAVIDPERPELSSLVFSRVDRRGMPREGYLPLYEIAALRLKASLVTLSACGTGLGKQVPGEGTIGLGWGFLHAGAKTVVVSLWDVEDESTAELMRLFYQNLLGPRHLRPAAALRRAQIAMLQTRSSIANSWSGWAVIGEWR